MLGRLCSECVSKRVLSASAGGLGAGVVKETFAGGEELRCLLLSALPLTKS